MKKSMSKAEMPKKPAKKTMPKKSVPAMKKGGMTKKAC